MLPLCPRLLSMTPKTQKTAEVQPVDIGWPRGNGKKLSSSQAQLGQTTCLAVALFLSISCGPTYVRRLYISFFFKHNTSVWTMICLEVLAMQQTCSSLSTYFQDEYILNLLRRRRVGFSIKSRVASYKTHRLTAEDEMRGGGLRV